MIRKLTHTLLFVLCCIFIAEAQLNILPLGNSITYGNYRYDLWQMLIDEGIDFEFVGSVNSAPVSGGAMNSWPPYQGHTFDDSHEGHSGWKSYDILNESPWNPGAGNIYSWLWAYTPDMVLLHIGTNDLTHLSAQESADYIIQIIQAIQADNPNVVVFLAKIIPREGFYNEVLALNSLMESVAESAATATSCIRVVDHYSDFDLWADTYDGIHPNRNGDVKMAQRWTAAIVEHLDENEGNCGTFAVDCSSLDVNLSITKDINCYGGHNGEIKAQVSGATAPYQYQWSNGEQTAMIDGLYAGDYTLTLTDAQQCQSIITQTLSEPSQLNIMASATPVTLVGEDNGTAEVEAWGGTLPYSYEWSNGAITSQITNLSAGDYSVTVKDAKGCSRIKTATVTSPDCMGFNIELVAIDETCFGENDGQIMAQISGINEPYELKWSNGLDDEHLWSLEPGDYTLTVTDDMGCVEMANITVGQPAALDIVTIPIHTTCGLSNGVIELDVSGGHPPYSIDWASGATESIVTDLSAGVYEVTVGDANDCERIEIVEIDESVEMQLMIDKTDISCFGHQDGQAKITVVKGTAPFRYEWNHGANTADLQNLVVGDYVVEVKDVLDCSVTAMFPISSPDSLQAVVQTTAAIDSHLGTATIEVIGGTPIYDYVWSNGDSGQNMTELEAGMHEVTVTDANACQIVETVLIEQITRIEAILPTDSWVVYPNPIRDFCQVDIMFSEVQAFQLNVYNSFGILMQSVDYERQKLQIALDMKKYVEGIYFLALETDKGRLVEKLVVMR